MDNITSNAVTDDNRDADTGLRDILEEFDDSELVLGLVGAVGTQLERVSKFLKNELSKCHYKVYEIAISKDVIPLFVDTTHIPTDPGFDRTNGLMDAGNEARRRAKDNSILALGAVTRIRRRRKKEGASGTPEPSAKTAYIIRSLKHPEEVLRLRGIYGTGFYLIAAHSRLQDRLTHLTGYQNIDQERAMQLIERDSEEDSDNGQKVAQTFHLADFFIRIDTDPIMQQEADRIIRMLFGHPFTTPSFDEYAMFMAFSASLRSADLSRQVGAVIAKNNQVIAHGANECPSFGGGLYWPDRTNEAGYFEKPNGRDYVRNYTDDQGILKEGYDSNAMEQKAIVDKIVRMGKDSGLDPQILRTTLENSPIYHLTEYGRVVHAEMEALLSCARTSVSTQDAVLYSTTFPCHNCAKHLVAAGIRRVVYIEPYPKSKALEFHDDSIYMGFDGNDTPKDKVRFEPFVGVGPRRFFDLFSYRHGSGRKLSRKSGGFANIWSKDQSRMRMQLLPFSYLELEELAVDQVAEIELTQEPET